LRHYIKKIIDKIPNDATLQNRYISYMEEAVKKDSKLYNSSEKTRVLFAFRTPIWGYYKDFMFIMNCLIPTFEEYKYDKN